jgi:hypothetical protein
MHGGTRRPGIIAKSMADDLMARLVDRWVKGKAQHQTLM